jgi:hypothetical protein
VLAVLVGAALAAPRASGQGSVGPVLGPDVSLEALGRRLELGLLDVGITVGPRRLILNLRDEGRPFGGAASPYRLGDTDLRTDIGVDLRIRWPSYATGDAGAANALQPYVSLGPAMSVVTGEEATPGRATPRSELPMSLGMRGALGLTWQVTRDAALFGEYRLIQDRSFGSKAPGEIGIDLFYGFSLRF